MAGRLNAGQLRSFQAWHTAVWVALLAPSVLLWRNSVVWLVVMSHLTALATAFGGWLSARAEVAAETGGTP